MLNCSFTYKKHPLSKEQRWAHKGTFKIYRGNSTQNLPKFYYGHGMPYIFVKYRGNGTVLGMVLSLENRHKILDKIKT